MSKHNIRLQVQQVSKNKLLENTFLVLHVLERIYKDLSKSKRFHFCDIKFRGKLGKIKPGGDLTKLRFSTALIMGPHFELTSFSIKLLLNVTINDNCLPDFNHCSWFNIIFIFQNFVLLSKSWGRTLHHDMCTEHL